MKKTFYFFEYVISYYNKFYNQYKIKSIIIKNNLYQKYYNSNNIFYIDNNNTKYIAHYSYSIYNNENNQNNQIGRAHV